MSAVLKCDACGADKEPVQDRLVTLRVPEYSDRVKEYDFCNGLCLFDWVERKYTRERVWRVEAKKQSAEREADAKLLEAAKAAGLTVPDV